MAADELSLLVFKKVTELFKKLTEEQLAALANGSGELQFATPEATVRTGRARSSAPRKPKQDKPTPEEAANRLRRFASRDEAQSYLEGSGLLVAELKSVAKLLDVTTPSSITKVKLIERLVNGTAGVAAKYPALVDGSYR